jgi:hypothetical protein
VFCFGAAVVVAIVEVGAVQPTADFELMVDQVGSSHLPLPDPPPPRMTATS